jgi:hypothetical protein
MKIKASIVVMSHLSDAQVELSLGLKLSVDSHINFVKYIVVRYNDLNTEIDADELWSEFILTPYYKG